MRRRSVLVLVSFLVVALFAMPAVGLADQNISLTKTANPEALSAPGSVTYTYRVTNTSDAMFGYPQLQDDKLGDIDSGATPTGDVNQNERIDPGETWVFTKTVTINETTTNVATVVAQFYEGTDTATATAQATVTVATEEPAEEETETVVISGDIPDTGTPWFNLLLAGIVALFVGALGLVVSARRRHA